MNCFQAAHFLVESYQQKNSGLLLLLHGSLLMSWDESDKLAPGGDAAGRCYVGALGRRRLASSEVCTSNGEASSGIEQQHALLRVRLALTWSM